MTRSGVIIGLGIAMALQFFVLSGMVVKAAMPLWSGTEIRVKTVPVDPRSMFRGNYARLNYEIGSVPSGTLLDEESLRVGEVIYVTLQVDESGLYSFEDASVERPAQGVFLRGRVKNSRPPYRVNYGIEAYFAPKEKALQLEQELRNGGVAILMVTGSGSVALKDVVPDAAEE